jgi:DNA-binding response OmpR family regulator
MGARARDVRVVLLVDDHVDTREMYADYLRAMGGFEARHASTCTDAVDIAGRHSIDAVILDRGLPDGDGGEVCRRLRDDPRTREVPIIVLSGRADDGSLAADAYLLKPVVPETLLAELSRLLKLPSS